MKALCPCCGGHTKVSENQGGTVIIPEDGMVKLQALMARYPLRIGRILDIVIQMPEEELEKVLHLFEDILRR